MSFVTKFNQLVNSPDLAKLLLRIGFAGFFLLHGIHKIFAGTLFIQTIFIHLGLPPALAYLVYLGEVIAPLLMIIGMLTRLSAFISAGTAIIIILLMHSYDFFSLTKVGAWSIEHIGTFLVGFVAIMLLGSGKYAVKPD